MWAHPWPDARPAARAMVEGRTAIRHERRAQPQPGQALPISGVYFPGARYLTVFPSATSTSPAVNSRVVTCYGQDRWRRSPCPGAAAPPPHPGRSTIVTASSSPSAQCKARRAFRPRWRRLFSLPPSGLRPCLSSGPSAPRPCMRLGSGIFAMVRPFHWSVLAYHPHKPKRHRVLDTDCNSWDQCELGVAASVLA